MPVNINMGAIGGNNRKIFREGGWFIALAKTINQASDQPGSLMLAIFYPLAQVGKVNGLITQNIQGILKTLSPFLAAGFQPGNHAPDLSRYLG
jgi:hypothetical protein